MGVLNPSKQELRKKLLEVRDGLEHRSVYDIFILLWKACGQVLEGGEAV